MFYYIHMIFTQPKIKCYRITEILKCGHNHIILDKKMFQSTKLVFVFFLVAFIVGY